MNIYTVIRFMADELEVLLMSVAILTWILAVNERNEFIYID